METINLGKVAFAYKGDYNPATTYASKDVVFDGESSYISKSDGNVGNALSDATFWGYLAKGSVAMSEQNAEDIDTLRADLNKVETDLNLLIGIESETNFDFLSYFTTINSGIFALDTPAYGSVGETFGWYRTDYLDVSSADEVEYFGGANANSYGIAFYDSNKNPIKPNPFSSDYRASSITKTLPVPSGAFYFRASGKSGAYVKYITKISGSLDTLDSRIDNIDQSILNITSNSQMPDVYGIEIANTRPPKLLKSGPTFLSIIKNWGFIGDSYSSGEFEYIDSDGVTVKYIDWYDYSFGQFLMRINGTSGYNYSAGGMTAKTWCTTSGERTWNNGTGKILELKNSYVIQLGSNDANTGILVGNLSTDVDIDDYTNNSDTFAGWICGVIQRIKSINPKAIFFIATVRYTSESSKRLEFSALIREIPSILSNTYVIDIEKYGLKWQDEDAVSKFRSGTHPSAAGHYYQALVYNTLIDWEIRKNLNNFTQIQFVGTDYYR